MNDQFIVMLVIWYTVFVVSTTLHEAAHALAAWRLGDPTAYMGGQVTLDPTPHVRREPIGMIVAPLISFFFVNGQWMIGWASAPYDPLWAMRWPRRAALMALAGPAANLLLALLAGLALKYGLSTGYFGGLARWQFAHVVEGGKPGISEGIGVALSITYSLNLALAVFNMFPVPPFDGSAVLLGVLPERTARTVQDWLWDPNYRLLGLIAVYALGSQVVDPAVEWGVKRIYGIP